MRFPLIILVIIGSCAAVSSLRAADESMVVRTAHFVAIGDVGAGELRARAGGFEVLAESVHRLVPAVRPVFPRPVMIVALAKRPPGIEPGFMAGPPIAYAVSDPGGDDIGDAGVGYLRELVRSSLENVPLWVEVGCAEYLRTLRIDPASSRVTVGAPVARHVVALRSRALPLVAVLSATAESPVFADANNRPQFVAQSWLLVHYLLTEPARQSQLSAFLDLLGRHVDPEPAFQQAFSESHETMGPRLSDYYGRLLFASRQLPQAVQEGEVKAETYRVPSLLAVKSDLLLRAGRIKEAAATVVGEDADAIGVLARARDLQGRHDEARTLFRKATAGLEAGVLSRYYFGELLLATSAGAATASAKDVEAGEAAAVLTPLLEGFPSHPDVLALLGLADLNLRNPGAAFRRFDQAFRIFPRHEYALLIARAEIAGGDVAGARALLEPLATRGTTADVRKQAQALLRTVPQVTGPATAPSQTAMPVFREKRPGEQRESGTLTEIACSSQWVILHVRLRDRELRVASTRLDLIDFIAYGGTAPAIACGARQSPESVLITWRTEPTAPPGTEGIIVAVEFPPPARN